MKSLALFTFTSLFALFAPAWLPHRPAEGSLPPFQEGASCTSEIDNDFRQSMQAEVDGHGLQLTVSARFGGAVDSLTWNGKEFINIYDHGRQISYAWSLDDYGECLNPTEPGSASDGRGPTSTSRLLEVCTPEEDRLTTRTQPAYWLRSGERGFCNKGATTAINEDPLSDFFLNKSIQVGYQGLDNVIAFTAEVEVPEDYFVMQLEIPTGYLTYEFNRYYHFNPLSGELIEAESQPLDAPWSFQSTSTLPPILATPDGAYAMGAYTDEAIEYYGIFGFRESDPANTTNKWTIVRREGQVKAGSYTYRSFAIVGTLEAVQEAMRALYTLHPVDLNPPQGYVDVMDCYEIAGWAWDPKAPDKPLTVQFYRVEEDGSETLLTEVVAQDYREDLVSALGDEDGEHGYRAVPLRFLNESIDAPVNVYALNSVEGLPGKLLIGSGQRLTCEVRGLPPASAEPTAASAQEQDPESPTEEEAGSPFSLCGGGALPLALTGLIAGQRAFSRKKTSRAG